MNPPVKRCELCGEPAATRVSCEICGRLICDRCEAIHPSEDEDGCNCRADETMCIECV